MEKHLPERRSIRLRGYDYSEEGTYYLTICTHKRKSLFGKIDRGRMVLNRIGEIARKYWLEIPEHFPRVRLYEYVIMPNHVHGIIGIQVAAKDLHNNSQLHGTSKTVGSIVRGFKVGVTKCLRNNYPERYPRDKQIWQRNYFEHIIRNDKAYFSFVEYITNNPVNWEKDELKI